jgi:hypothetical protein
MFAFDKSRTMKKMKRKTAVPATETKTMGARTTTVIRNKPTVSYASVRTQPTAGPFASARLRC